MSKTKSGPPLSINLCDGKGFETKLVLLGVETLA